MKKLLKAIDQLESSGFWKKLDIAPIDIFGLKAEYEMEIHELNEQLFSNDIYDYQ